MSISTSNDAFTLKRLNPNWEIEVSPVPRWMRHLINSLLLTEAFSIFRTWLIGRNSYMEDLEATGFACRSTGRPKDYGTNGSRLSDSHPYVLCSKRWGPRMPGVAHFSHILRKSVDPERSFD